MDESTRVFSESTADTIVNKVIANFEADGMDLMVQVSSYWESGQSWGRNRSTLGSDTREISVRVLQNTVSGIFDEEKVAWHSAVTNQVDIVSLNGVSQFLKRLRNNWKSNAPVDMEFKVAESNAKGIDVWSDNTFNRSAVENAEAIGKLTLRSHEESLLSAGYLSVNGASTLRYYRDEWGKSRREWGRSTNSQCSLTVRHPKGTGSGWAGRSSSDIDRVNIAEVADLALEKCIQSLDPVRLEPGRYQVILEPEAANTMVHLLLDSLGREFPERMGRGPVYLGNNQAAGRKMSKLGLKIVDERISIYHDPTHHLYGTHVAPMHTRSDMITNGVLTALGSGYNLNLNEQSVSKPVYHMNSYMMSGGDTTIEEMISTTSRAMLVARLQVTREVNSTVGLNTGFTRDGLWLIEGGKITKSVRNFRWAESPFFALNNVEQIGLAETVFSPNDSRVPFRSLYSSAVYNRVVPAIKVNDFSFTATIDAI